MFQQDWLVLVVMGAVFVVLGMVAIVWDRSEEKSYYDSLTSRRDVREFMEHQPQRPQLGALKIGGRIAIAVGAFMLVMGGALWLWS
jgi:hypothetical protein